MTIGGENYLDQRSPGWGRAKGGKKNITLPGEWRRTGKVGKEGTQPKTLWLGSEIVKKKDPRAGGPMGREVKTILVEEGSSGEEIQPKQGHEGVRSVKAANSGGESYKGLKSKDL